MLTKQVFGMFHETTVMTCGAGISSTLLWVVVSPLSVGLCDHTLTYEPWKQKAMAHFRKLVRWSLPLGVDWDGRRKGVGLERREVRADLGPWGVRDLKDHLNAEVTSEKERWSGLFSDFFKSSWEKRKEWQEGQSIRKSRLWQHTPAWASLQ